jgi:hypothetical protein
MGLRVMWVVLMMWASILMAGCADDERFGDVQLDLRFPKLPITHFPKPHQGPK